MKSATHFTTLLREFVDALQMPLVVYPCASVSDGSFGGTPAQWSTRRASTPLELIRTSLLANPVVILNEIEKSGTLNHNGSLVHSLLPLLELHSAASYFETALETNADLSGVNFLATANDLAMPGLPFGKIVRSIRRSSRGCWKAVDKSRRS